jgi:peptidyl-prolyl cis-trans isomerase A (cyclophilin A)
MRALFAAVSLLPLVTFAQGKFTQAATEGKDLYATLDTTQGQIVIRLFSKDAPKTVANFVGLATGEKEFTDAKGKKAKKPFYNGLTFHRVIPDFMIQGGDPLGTGQGGPGYKFDDELQSGRKFDKVGLVAMANSGTNSNGSQFFITTSTPAGLNGKHTIFGEVIAGYDVAVAISRVPKSEENRPYTPQVMKRITISDKAPPAKKTTAAK